LRADFFDGSQKLAPDAELAGVFYTVARNGWKREKNIAMPQRLYEPDNATNGERAV
jgi:hypothetical protein